MLTCLSTVSKRRLTIKPQAELRRAADWLPFLFALKSKITSFAALTTLLYGFLHMRSYRLD